MISIEYKYLKTRFFVEEKLFNKSPHLNHLVKYFLTRQKKKKERKKGVRTNILAWKLKTRGSEYSRYLLC